MVCCVPSLEGPAGGLMYPYYVYVYQQWYTYACRGRWLEEHQSRSAVPFPAGSSTNTQTRKHNPHEVHLFIPGQTGRPLASGFLAGESKRGRPGLSGYRQRTREGDAAHVDDPPAHYRITHRRATRGGTIRCCFGVGRGVRQEAPAWLWYDSEVACSASRSTRTAEEAAGVAMGAGPAATVPVESSRRHR